MARSDEAITAVANAIQDAEAVSQIPVETLKRIARAVAPADPLHQFDFERSSERFKIGRIGAAAVALYSHLLRNDGTPDIKRGAELLTKLAS